MQKCNYCGADLTENTRFCWKCGSVQDTIATNAAATSSNTQSPQSWAPEDDTISATRPPDRKYPTQSSTATWSPNVQTLETPPPVAENEDDEDRDGIASWASQYGAIYGVVLTGDALLSNGQAYTPGAPAVQGTPQIGNVPSVPGSPAPHTNATIGHSTTGAGNAAPAGHSTTGAGNAASVGHPVQGPANATIGHPVQGPAKPPTSHPVQAPAKPPTSHPVQAPTKPPTSHPVQGPQPPKQPGTHEHHPKQGSHHHDDHTARHEPHQNHDEHTTRHEPYRARVSKATGSSTVKTIMIVVAAVVVVAAGGIGAVVHFLSRPQPLISISSTYKVGNAPAGTTGTSLHIGGQQFASNSAITFLLDGHAAPGNPSTQSDSNGNFSAVVTITDAWSVGTHTLTAKDGSNDSTKNSVSVTIVQPGQANTPGPNGAPPDDATFTLKVTTEPDIAQPFSSNPVLIITGHTDPEGGSVCSPDDNGQSFTQNDTTPNDGTPFTRVETATCSGTYKAGQISYTQTDTSVKISSQSNGVNVTCELANPTVNLRLTGSYVGNNTFKGTINSPYFAYTCDQQGYSWWHEAAQGVSWTGTMVTQ